MYYLGFASKSGSNYLAAPSTFVGNNAVILTQPTDVIVPEARLAVFNCIGQGVVTYQWYDASTNLPLLGETNSSLSLLATEEQDGDQFYCIVTASGGSIQSNTVTLTVLTSISIFVSTIFIGSFLSSFKEEGASTFVEHHVYGKLTL